MTQTTLEQVFVKMAKRRAALGKSTSSTAQPEEASGQPALGGQQPAPALTNEQPTTTTTTTSEQPTAASQQPPPAASTSKEQPPHLTSEFADRAEGTAAGAVFPVGANHAWRIAAFPRGGGVGRDACRSR